MTWYSATRISIRTSPALTQPNRFRMLLHLRQYPEVHKRLIFGTDYPLSVYHFAAWGRVAFGTLRKMIRTKNRFDRQVEVCTGLTLSFPLAWRCAPSFNGKDDALAGC